MPKLSIDTAATKDFMAEAYNENTWPATQKKEESKEPEAIPDAASKKRLRRIKRTPDVPQDPTLYLKTWTGNE